MFRRFICLVMALSVLSLAACSSTLEGVNNGAKEVGKPAGKVMRIPGSVSEGAAEGIAGEADENPYGR